MQTNIARLNTDRSKVQEVYATVAGALLTTSGGTGTTSDQVQGAAADGAAVVGNPILMGGQDGVNAQSILVDTTGRQVMVGAAADGAAISGNPVLVGGQDGTNVQSFRTDTSGNQFSTPMVGGTALANSSGNVANASAVATLTGAVSISTYISGFTVTAAGATAGLPVIVTVTGLSGGTLSYIFSFPTGALVGATPLVVTFSTPMISSAANTNIVVTLPAGGVGNTHAAVSAIGYRV